MIKHANARKDNSLIHDAGKLQSRPVEGRNQLRAAPLFTFMSVFEDSYANAA